MFIFFIKIFYEIDSYESTSRVYELSLPKSHEST